MTDNTKTPLISVVLCTYNPREDFLGRVFDGLKDQTLSKDLWELVVVDNNSTRPLSSTTGPQDDKATAIDLSWHPDARIVVETQQGLSHARRRGFEEATGDLIVNLDDDAVLDSDYLKQVVRLAEQFPLIGVFGCALRAEFEVPARWPTDEYYAAQRVVPQAVWSNDPLHHLSNPWGAGSVVRRPVARAYVQRLADDCRYAQIGRTAERLLACEDDDIAMTACEVGFGKGVFPSLCFTHLIKASHMTEDFLCRNARGHAYSGTVLEFLRFGRRPVNPTVRARLNRAYRLACMKSRRRRQELARDQGVKEAFQDMKRWGWL
jgi:glycosyltransferase involved in cell wall biosynthesis